MSSEIPVVPKARRKSYSLAFKRQVINESEDSGNIRATARKHNIQPSQIRGWKESLQQAVATTEERIRATGNQTTIRREYCRLQSTKRSRYKAGGRKTTFSNEFLKRIKEYIDERRRDDKTVTMQMIKVEALRIDPTLDIGDDAFRLRMYRMMRKWEVSWRRRTTTAKCPQNTRHTMSVIEEFIRYFNYKVTLLDITLDDVFNVDQTNLPFNLENIYTWARRSSRSVAVPGVATAQRATVMLGCNATGSCKLKPFIVYKGASGVTGRIYQELRRRDGYSPDCEYAVQEKAWFNERIMLQWIDSIWRPLIETRQNRKTYLLLDDFGVHLTRPVLTAFSDLRTEIEVIPAGYTARLQAMDVGLNKPFKNYSRKLFDTWLSQQPPNTKPHRRNASFWAAESWDSITVRTIQKTWNHIGLTSFRIDPIENVVDNNNNNNNNDVQEDNNNLANLNNNIDIDPMLLGDENNNNDENVNENENDDDESTITDTTNDDDSTITDDIDILENMLNNNTNTNEDIYY
jgi:transposase-like protein